MPNVPNDLSALPVVHSPSRNGEIARRMLRSRSVHAQALAQRIVVNPLPGYPGFLGFTNVPKRNPRPRTSPFMNQIPTAPNVAIGNRLK